MTADHRIHFHIRWSSTSELDYDCFASREEAGRSAEQLVRPNETYSVEEFDDSCEKCAAMSRVKHRSYTD